ncbi:class I SAM-dependent rRNA methyltransferase, partial [candidate division WOR-3 bacterium]|nr:class I SAM-dependent rRNA methyltransferase [candidate division WOR-3 bacterium]
MPDKRVLCSRRRGRGRHPWVFSNEVQRSEGEPGPGDAVLVFDRGRLVGSALYNPHSLIAARLYSGSDEAFDSELLGSRLLAARERRRAALPGEEDFRLAHGEPDGLPGLVVDKYGDQYVVQAHSVGIDQRLELVSRALVEQLGATAVYERDDSRLREPEGLPRVERALFGEPGEAMVSENGARFRADLRHGQKTGWFFDQRVTRRRVRALARDRSCLDVFSYSGGFAVNAALGGAKRVAAVDSSAAACSLGAANAELNKVGDRCEFRCEEAFRFLESLPGPEAGFDLVVLDPPSFIKSKREKQGGLRGFRRINAAAMRLLPEGGILVTCSCSHHLSWPEMRDMLAAAAEDAGR